MRSLAIGGVALVIAGVVGGLVAVSRGTGADEAAARARRLVDGVWVDGGVTDAQAFAFGQPTLGDSPRLVHPPAGAVWPATFPPPRIQWHDLHTDRLYRLTVHRGDHLLLAAVTARTTFRPAPEAWAAVVASSEPIVIQVSAARIAPDGTRDGTAVAGTPIRVALAPKAESPDGMILFGAKHRPPSAPPGTLPLLLMHLQIEGVDLERFEHRLFFRSSYGPKVTTIDPGRWAEDLGDDNLVTATQCVSCHSISGTGRYVAVFSQTMEEAPASFDAPNGFVTVLEMPARKVLAQLPHAFMPMFNPVQEHLMAFGQVDETIGAKDEMIVRRSDIHVLDVRSGRHAPVPGASTPDRVENLPFWRPDGRRLVFFRTKPGEVWHGSAGHLDLATVDYDDGRGGVAEPVRGASDNGKSNFMAVYSPDSRWIVFTQADQGFFSQQSSDLMIVPADGGVARRLACSSPLTDSWHRFSPNGLWLGVVSNREDVRRPHIYVARFDTAQGTCSPAVQLPGVSGPNAHTHAFSWTRRFDWFDAADFQDLGRAAFAE